MNLITLYEMKAKIYGARYNTRKWRCFNHFTLKATKLREFLSIGDTKDNWRQAKGYYVVKIVIRASQLAKQFKSMFNRPQLTLFIINHNYAKTMVNFQQRNNHYRARKAQCYCITIIYKCFCGMNTNKGIVCHISSLGSIRQGRLHWLT